MISSLTVALLSLDKSLCDRVLSIVSIAGICHVRTIERADRDGRKSHDIGGCDLTGLGENIASRTKSVKKFVKKICAYFEVRCVY